MKEWPPAIESDGVRSWSIACRARRGRASLYRVGSGCPLVRALGGVGVCASVFRRVSSHGRHVPRRALSQRFRLPAPSIYEDLRNGRGRRARTGRRHRRNRRAPFHRGDGPVRAWASRRSTAMWLIDRNDGGGRAFIGAQTSGGSTMRVSPACAANGLGSSSSRQPGPDADGGPRTSLFPRTSPGVVIDRVWFDYLVGPARYSPIASRTATRAVRWPTTTCRLRARRRLPAAA